MGGRWMTASRQRVLCFLAALDVRQQKHVPTQWQGAPPCHPAGVSTAAPLHNIQYRHLPRTLLWLVLPMSSSTPRCDSSLSVRSLRITALLRFMLLSSFFSASSPAAVRKTGKLSSEVCLFCAGTTIIMAIDPAGSCAHLVAPGSGWHHAAAAGAPAPLPPP